MISDDEIDSGSGEASEGGLVDDHSAELSAMIARLPESIALSVQAMLYPHFEVLGKLIVERSAVASDSNSAVSFADDRSRSVPNGMLRRLGMGLGSAPLSTGGVGGLDTLRVDTILLREQRQCVISDVHGLLTEKLVELYVLSPVIVRIVRSQYLLVDSVSKMQSVGEIPLSFAGDLGVMYKDLAAAVGKVFTEDEAGLSSRKAMYLAHAYDYGCDKRLAFLQYRRNPRLTAPLSDIELAILNRVGPLYSLEDIEVDYSQNAASYDVEGRETLLRIAAAGTFFVDSSQLNSSTVSSKRQVPTLAPGEVVETSMSKRLRLLVDSNTHSGNSRAALYDRNAADISNTSALPFADVHFWDADSVFSHIYDRILKSSAMRAMEKMGFHAKVSKDHPFIVRLDGRAFSTYTRGMKTPHDDQFRQAMLRTSADLVLEFNPSLAYHQSDEITVVFFSYSAGSENIGNDSDFLFGGRALKLASVLSGFASSRFNYHISSMDWSRYPEETRDRINSQCAHFDARVFQITNDVDVLEYVAWRQAEGFRNAVMTLTTESVAGICKKGRDCEPVCHD
eukprot:ANDGO_00612.mRNA.1 Uncharacterized protein R259